MECLYTVEDGLERYSYLRARENALWKGKGLGKVSF